MAHIFATQRSEEAITRLIQVKYCVAESVDLRQSPSVVLELFMLQGIVLTYIQRERILSRAAGVMRTGLFCLSASLNDLFSDGSAMNVFLEGHHTGITIPIKYSTDHDANG